MIAHPLKTVFVHIPKTAGYSIEHLFLFYLGLEQDSRSALLLRKKLSHESGPPRLSHLTASEYVSGGFLNTEQRKDYFFFTVVRNPWTRVKSFYHYLKFDQRSSLNEFVEHQLEVEVHSGEYAWFMRPQSEFIYDDDDKVLVDKICRFESLQADVESVLTKIGMPAMELPVANTSRVILNDDSTSNDALERFSNASNEVVSRLYRRDIELLGYEPL